VLLGRWRSREKTEGEDSGNSIVGPIQDRQPGPALKAMEPYDEHHDERRADRAFHSSATW
jgi:hypothetical protein